MHERPPSERMMRVRFAPAPTGHLQLNGLRVALANDLFARRGKGRMLLRLDDLEQDGKQPLPAAQIEHELGWFGIEWHDSFRQSDRLAFYRDTIERLESDRFIYPCFESEEELKAKQEFRRKRNQPATYDRAMLSLTPRQRQDAEAGGRRPHWRFRLSGRTLEWTDLVLGPRRAALPAVSDPVLVRADGLPTPILASVVDDVAYGTTHIIRGEDSAGNTAVQIELFEVLQGSARRVQFAHLPALSDGGRISHGGRKAGSMALKTLCNDGVEPDAIAACLTGLVGAPGSLQKLAHRFDLATLANARFDMTEMLALNRRLLAAKPFAAVADRLPNGATEAFWLAVRGNLDLLKEARGWWDVVAGTIVPPVIEGASALLLTAESLLPAEPWDSLVWSTWISAVERATKHSGEALLEPLRLALTGEDDGPDLGNLLPLIGRSRAASRLAIAAA